MKKVVVFILFTVILASSCASMKDKRAANHQPYKPHKDQKPKQRHHR